MKLGCLGFLALLLVLAVVFVGGASAIYLAGGMFEAPPWPSAIYYTLSDGYRAQDKIFELILRDSGRSFRHEPVLITEREVNAYLQRHLEEKEGIRLSPLVVKLSDDEIHLQGKTALRDLFKGFPFYLLPDYLPSSALDRPVWVTVRGTIRLDRERGMASRDYTQLEVKTFSLGNQGLGAWLLSLLLGRERLQWRVPAVVETIKVQEGAIVISTRK